MQRGIILANVHTHFSANHATVRTLEGYVGVEKNPHYRLIKMQIRDVSLPGRGAWHDMTKWSESLKKQKGSRSDSASRPLLVL